MLRRLGSSAASASARALCAAPVKAPKAPLARFASSSSSSSSAASSASATSAATSSSSASRLAVAGGAAAIVAFVGYETLANPKVAQCAAPPCEPASAQGSTATEDPEKKAARLAHLRPVENPADLEIVLYQYQTCPFCTKVRTFLDYYNIPYRIVEVDPLRKTEIGYSKYKKVPICVVQGVQLVESTEIITTILSLLPSVKSKITAEEAQNDAVWCKWVDDWLVHLLPANIYRTPTEAIESFDYLLNPQYNFGTLERLSARYVGASVMYLVTKYKLNKKYNITQPREQFYEAVNKWIDALGDNEFMSGTHRPSRADLAVYATVRSVEGTAVFGDLLANTRMEKWFTSMKAAVGHCKGEHVQNPPKPTHPIVL